MCVNLIGRDSCPSAGRKDGMCSKSEAIISVPTVPVVMSLRPPVRQSDVLSQQMMTFDVQRDAPVQRRITPIDDHFTSHVCGSCVTSLGL